MKPDKSKFVVVSKWFRCFNFFLGSRSAKLDVELVAKCSNWTKLWHTCRMSSSRAPVLIRVTWIEPLANSMYSYIIEKWNVGIIKKWLLLHFLILIHPNAHQKYDNSSLSQDCISSIHVTPLDTCKCVSWLPIRDNRARRAEGLHFSSTFIFNCNFSKRTKWNVFFIKV